VSCLSDHVYDCRELGKAKVYCSERQASDIWNSASAGSATYMVADLAVELMIFKVRRFHPYHPTHGGSVSSYVAIEYIIRIIDLLCMYVMTPKTCVVLLYRFWATKSNTGATLDARASRWNDANA